jgi:hypothetical protein
MNKAARPPGTGRNGIDWRTIAASPLVLAALATFIGAHVLLYGFYRDSQRDAMRAAEETLATLVFALAQHVEGTLGNADQLLRIARQTYVDDPQRLASIYEGHNAAVDRKSFPLEGVISADGFAYLAVHASLIAPSQQEAVFVWLDARLPLVERFEDGSSIYDIGVFARP